MNRREFLTAVGAASVTAYFASMPIISVRSPTDLLPWQQHIWAMLERGKKVMYVTSTQLNAWRVFNLFKRHKKLHCTSIGAGVIGRVADLIVMDDFNDDIDPEWFDVAIRTRLSPGGKLEWIYT